MYLFWCSLAEIYVIMSLLTSDDVPDVLLENDDE